MRFVLRLVAASCLALACAGVLTACSNASRLNARCLTGDLQRCRQLGDMYAAGNGVPQDFGRAASLYERVCEGGVAEVCNTLGEIYERVPGFESEAKRVPELYDRACNAGSSTGCLNSGLQAVSIEEYVQAATLFDRACLNGAEAGCYQLGGLYRNGDGVEKDMTRAVALYEQACNADLVVACDTLSLLFAEGKEVDADAARAGRYLAKVVEFYNLGCEAGVERDCRERDRYRTRLSLRTQGR
jgi:TPR repeat protein